VKQLAGTAAPAVFDQGGSRLSGRLTGDGSLKSWLIFIFLPPTDI